MSYVVRKRRGGLRGRGMGDWSDIIDTAISTAGNVAQVALKPPTYSSVVNPMTGASSITSYAPLPTGSGLFSGSGFGGSVTGSISPMWFLLGGGLLLFLVLRPAR